METAGDNKAILTQPFPVLNVKALSVETILIMWFCLTPFASFFIRFPTEQSLLTFDRLIFFSLAVLLLLNKFGVLPLGRIAATQTIRHAFTATKFEIAWAGLAALALISAVAQADNFGYATKIAVDAFWLPLMAFVLARRFFQWRGFANYLLLAAIALAFLLFLTGAYEFLTGANLFAYKGSEVLREGERRVNGPFASDSSFAIISLLLTLFLRAAPRLFNLKFDRSARIIYLCALAASAVATLLPLFRSVVVALILCLALLEILLHLKDQSLRQTFLSFRFFRSRRLRLYLVMMFLVVLPAIALIEMQRSSSIVRRLTSPRNLYARLATWQTAGRIVAENPLFGVGLANYSDYFDAMFSDWREDKDYVADAKAVDTPHSNFLWIASELGLSGFLFYLLAYIYLLQISYRNWQHAQSSQQRLASGFFLILILAYTLPGLTLASGSYSDLNLYFFFLLGVFSNRFVLLNLHSSS